ncbi:hypothetical protein COMNV_00718 [Commensalibacter sp. Nvir]|uniref:ricin-type beta-trefoil lectin domain protein n=1 Tax=Commensalibacter sp. Nvir TaxID=3069817 RepID=UPI002D62BCC6|nr:hypothetical protein COMNV_00718 [Commensalibacter sp. Nvir]
MKKNLIKSFVFAFVALNAPSFAFATGQTPGSYTYYKLPSMTVNAVDFFTTINQSPGFQSQVFWSHQFSLSDNTSGYTGMQTNGGTDNHFLFSVWDGVAAKTGSSGTYCEKFSEQGTGYSCRLNYNWKQGHTYKYHLFYQNTNWLTLTVTDLTDNTSFTLGSIQTNATSLSSTGLVDWVEYYEWNSDRSTCLGQPYSNAAFGVPIAYNASGTQYKATVSSSSKSSTCQDYTNIFSTETHKNGIGNSARGSIKNNQACLDSSGGISEGTSVITYSCTNGINQGWVYSKDHSLQTAYNYCLVDDNGLKLETCNKAKVSTQWEITGNQIKKANTSSCLTNTSKGSEVTLTQCDSSSPQQWDVSQLSLSN